MDGQDPGRSKPAGLCIRLRSKKVYALDRRPETAEDVLDGSGHCWCTRTMMALGPDGERVDPERCRAGRDCCESIP
jgi:hypothetical protein